ncbi:MAG: DinB family protein [Salibacteraceae bacterium]
MNVFDVNRKTRENILKLINGLGTDDLNRVPDGFSNNLIWHLGHVLATQQLLTYGLSGSEIIISNNIIDEFRKGTKPENGYTTEDISELKEIFMEVINITQEDFELEELNSNSFKEYPTSYGITLKSLKDALEFNNMHEAMHLGMMMVLKKTI